MTGPVRESSFAGEQLLTHTYEGSPHPGRRWVEVHRSESQSNINKALRTFVNIEALSRILAETPEALRAELRPDNIVRRAWSALRGESRSLNKLAAILASPRVTTAQLNEVLNNNAVGGVIITELAARMAQGQNGVLSEAAWHLVAYAAQDPALLERCLAQLPSERHPQLKELVLWYSAFCSEEQRGTPEGFARYQTVARASQDPRTTERLHALAQALPPAKLMPKLARFFDQFEIDEEGQRLEKRWAKLSPARLQSEWARFTQLPIETREFRVKEVAMHHVVHESIARVFGQGLRNEANFTALKQKFAGRTDLLTTLEFCKLCADSYASMQAALLKAPGTVPPARREPPPSRPGRSA